MIYILIVIAIYITAGFLYSIRSKVTTYNIKSKKIKRSYKFLFISDYHSNSALGILENLKDNLKNTDAIFLGGDIIDDKPDSYKINELVDIIENVPTFYVTGNHEIRRTDLDVVLEYMSKYSTVLSRKNSPQVLEELNIYGVDDLAVNYDDYLYSLADFKSRIDKKKFNILLVHRPEDLEKFADVGFDLVLSGHVHAGHIRFLFLGGLMGPGQGLFPKYQYGEYQVGNTRMFLTSGATKKRYVTPRFYNKAEVVIINLTEEI
ncbi:MAG: metallophosphoesterase [Ezakiella sp.]|nr:metallophosphoesterase [Ezakiella sp.]MDD7471348.1 metallophosphoesterase [Bacillota bacterium]MDY3923557.1 metallophosphoesterase [Ezakiella sp.]